MLSNESIQGLAKLAANYPSTWSGNSDTADSLNRQAPGILSVYGNNVKGLSGASALKDLANKVPARPTVQRNQDYGDAFYDTYFGGPGSGFDVGTSNMMRAPGGVARVVGGGLASAGGAVGQVLPSGYGGDTADALLDAGSDMVYQGGGQYLDAISGDMTPSEVRNRADSQRSLNRANTQMQQFQNRDLSAGEQSALQAADLTTDLAASFAAFTPTTPVFTGGAAAANAAKATSMLSKAVPAVGRLDSVVRGSGVVRGAANAGARAKGVYNAATKPLQAVTRTNVPLPATMAAKLRAGTPILQKSVIGGSLGLLPAELANANYQNYRDNVVVAPGPDSPATPASPSDVSRDPSTIANPYERAVAQGQSAAISRMAPNANSSYRFYNDPGVQTPKSPAQLPVSRDPRSIMNPYDRALATGKQPSTTPATKKVDPLAYRSRRQHAIKKGPNEGQSQFLSRARKQYNDTVSRRSARAAEFVKNRPELFGNK